MSMMKLSECCLSISDGDHMPPPKANTGIPFVIISDIGPDNKLHFENTAFVPIEYWYSVDDKRKPHVGDVLYSVTGSYGIPIYIDFEREFVFQRHIAILRPDPAILDGNYLYYLLKNPATKALVDKLVTGAVQKTLGLDVIRNMSFDIPSLEKQHETIALLSALDDRINNNAAICFDLEAMVKLLYDYWFVQFDFPNETGKPYKSSGGKMVWNEMLKREIPEGWEINPFDSMCSMMNGINYDKNEAGNKDYRIVNVRNITASSFLIDEKDLDTIVLKSNSADRYIVNADDILIARSGTPGAVRLLLNPAPNTIFCGFIIRCSPNDSINRLYLAYAMKKLEGTSATKTGGSILQNVSQDTLGRVAICVPPKAIIERFNRQASGFLSAVQNLIVENGQLAELRDFLLPMLMNGQVKVGKESA